uniref:Uncharacterized protein n=1 Tax=Pristionchus pacificus TaxID=54126 RepID=A0A2A6BK25_PRIPA|eukprot:PDM66141.1 hypothetical protein PRIPAC_45366 [Pristionchus pacificus]
MSELSEFVEDAVVVDELDVVDEVDFADSLFRTIVRVVFSVGDEVVVDVDVNEVVDGVYRTYKEDGVVCGRTWDMYEISSFVTVQIEFVDIAATIAISVHAHGVTSRGAQSLNTPWAK